MISGDTGYKKTDERILKSVGEIRKLNYQSKWYYLNPRIIFNVMWADLILVWFASKHTIPVVLLNYFFNKPLIIISGGFDVANVQKIKYGAMRGGSRTIVGRWLLSRSHTVVSVSKSNRKEIIDNGKVSPRKVKLIYNAILSPTFTNDIIKKRQVF